MKDFDIIIAGGGMVGSTAAIALAELGLNIALIEPVQPEHNTSASFDQRAVALSAASVSIFKSLGVWDKLKPFAERISKIHVSDKGHFGFARIDAEDYQVEALGEVIPLEQTGPALWQMIEKNDNIKTFCPFNLVRIGTLVEHVKDKPIEVGISDLSGQELTLSAKLLLGSDGTFSTVAKLAGIESHRNEYQQHAIIANISTDQPHQNRAFERFTKNGPIALLPLTRNRMSLVWCHNPENCDAVMQYDDQLFIQQLQANFGYRLGLINKVGSRYQYPLALHVAKKPFGERVLLLGNSAHTLHPIAGQGFNVGLRDVAALRDAIELSTKCCESDFGSYEFLKCYQESRQPDWDRTILATDSLVRIFSHEFLPIVLARNKALNILDKIPFIKEQLARSAMGLTGESAKLTRGIKLSDERLE